MASVYPLNGVDQVCLVSIAAEATYGETIAYGAGLYEIAGLVEGGDISSKSTQNKIYGIGKKAWQARVQGTVENGVRMDITNPEADILNRAIPDAGVLRSYNLIAGVSDGADVDAWQLVGGKADTLELSIDDGEGSCLKASMDWIVKNILDTPVNASAAGHDASGGPIWQLAGAALTITIPAVTAYEFASARISVRNNLQRKNVASATNTPKRTISHLRDGNFEIEATFGFYEPPTNAGEAIYALLSNDCPPENVAAVLTFTDMCSGAALETTLTGGAYSGIGQPFKPNDDIDFPIDLSFDDISIVYTP